MVRVFVYGTLTDRERLETVLDRFSLGPAAILRGLHRVEGRYPTLAPGGNCEGRLVETSDIDRLDAYEGVDRGLYVRVPLPVSNGDTAECYVGDPALLDADARWPGVGEFDERVYSHLDEHSVEIDQRE